MTNVMQNYLLDWIELFSQWLPLEPDPESRSELHRYLTHMGSSSMILCTMVSMFNLASPSSSHESVMVSFNCCMAGLESFQTSGKSGRTFFLSSKFFICSKLGVELANSMGNKIECQLKLGVLFSSIKNSRENEWGQNGEILDSSVFPYFLDSTLIYFTI